APPAVSAIAVPTVNTNADDRFLDTVFIPHLFISGFVLRRNRTNGCVGAMRPHNPPKVAMLYLQIG
ncbi:MAG: hypothetical protein AAGD25_34755, partial [Cyanobacteria bacterium P01_F01_bin.150]